MWGSPNLREDLSAFLHACDLECFLNDELQSLSTSSKEEIECGLLLPQPIVPFNNIEMFFFNDVIL